MELSYVLSAVRRYWWVVVVCVAIGAIPLLTRTTEPDRYVSEAVVLVSPPSESRVQVTFTNDPDRYVIGQLAVLRSDALAAEVAEQIGGGATAENVADAVTIEHTPATDIVEIEAAALQPERAQEVVNAYVDRYFASLGEQVDQAQTPELAELDARLLAIGESLTAVDAAIAEAMEPYLETVGDPDAGPVPTVEQVAPNLVSQKSTLLGEYTQILTLKTELEVSSKLRVTSRVVQRGSLPTAAEPQSSNLELLALLGGLVVGLTAAVVLARVAPKVLDRQHVATILRRPHVVDLPRSGALRRDPRAAVEHLPAKLVPVVDGLCVRAEEAGRLGEPLVVLVAGSQRVAGATTLAGAMANRFAVSGVSVLLVDANPRNPELSRRFAPDAPGLAALADGPTRPAGAAVGPNLAVVGLSDTADLDELRRHRVQSLVDGAAQRADVVVIDAGSLQNSVWAVQMLRLVDVVVLAVPVARQRTDELQAIGRQLSAVEAEVLVVTTPARPHHGGDGDGAGYRFRGGAEDVEPEAELVVSGALPAPTGPTRRGRP